VSRPLTFTTVENVPLVGGSLCLDFVNTTGARASTAPRERLTHFGDLLTWSERAGILDASAAGRLRPAASRRRDHAADVLTRARRFREDLYELLSAFVDGHRPSTRAVARLAAQWRVARRNQELILGQRGLEFRIAANERDFAALISAITIDAVDLLTSDRLLRLKRCAECDWLFLDTSKNSTRRWCKSTCGNRARSRERYERLQRAAASRSKRAPSSRPSIP
jgi:predicted RNA-binding Zn ribbon-like protein